MSGQQMMRAFGVRKQPPLTQKQLELLEAGFNVKPNYDPFFYKDNKMELPNHIERILQ